MAADPEVLRALESVLESDSSNTSVRLHLAELLSGIGESARALTHLERVLSAQPDNVVVLRLAAEAAAAGGDHARAAAWRRLYEALDAEQPESPPTAHQRQREGAQATWPGPGALDEVPAAKLPDVVSTDWDAEMQLLVDKEKSERITLADVAGLVEVKERLERSFLGRRETP